MLFFFIHRFNDIDHFAPVVYRIAKDTNEKIMILCFNMYYDIYSDFRLKFLREKYNVSVEYLYNIHNPSILYKVFGYFVRTSYIGGSFGNNVRILFKHIEGGKQSGETFCHDLFHLIFGLLRSLVNRTRILNNEYIRNYYGIKWVAEMIDKFKPSVMVFDHAATNRIYNVSALMEESKRKSIPTVSLPHGIPLFLEHCMEYNKTKQDFVNNECDFLVLQHRRWSDECIRYGLNPDRPIILGLVRYCREWEEVLEKIIPPDTTLNSKGKGKLKIVYMDSGPNRFPQYNIEAQEAINRICRMDFVHMIYKPHTRRNKAHLQLPKSAELSSVTNSFNLVKWADVVIGMSSSIMIEALIQDKVYISPTYFRDRKLIYEEYGACWMVDSHEELEDAIKKLKNDPSCRPYSMKNVENFLTDVIYDGRKDRDVLGVYEDFILSIVNGKRDKLR